MGKWDYSTVAPGSADPAALSTVAPASANPAALSVVAPGASNPPALSATAPGSANPPARTVNAPASANPPALSTNAPASAAAAALSANAPASSAAPALSVQPPAAVAPAALSAVAPASAPFAASTAIAPSAANPARYTSEPPRSCYTPTLAPLTDDNVNTPTINIEGSLVLNSIYGQTRIPQSSVLERVQLALDSAPVGGPATITLVDSVGTTYGVTVTVLAGENFGEAVLGAPLALNAGANIRAKCTATPGGDTPGGYGLLTLFTRFAS